MAAIHSSRQAIRWTTWSGDEEELEKRQCVVKVHKVKHLFGDIGFDYSVILDLTMNL